jgi:hypothetical protein
MSDAEVWNDVLDEAWWDDVLADPRARLTGDDEEDGWYMEW